MTTDFVAIPAITVICYLVSEIYKIFMAEDCYRHIPVVCGVTGAVLGILCFLFIEAYIPAENLIIAAAIGAVSGWGATGINQIVKQEGSSDAEADLTD